MKPGTHIFDYNIKSKSNKWTIPYLVFVLILFILGFIVRWEFFIISFVSLFFIPKQKMVHTLKINDKLSDADKLQLLSNLKKKN